MSKQKNIIKIMARQKDLYLLSEGVDDYVGIPCLVIDVLFPEVVYTPDPPEEDGSTNAFNAVVKSIKIPERQKRMCILMQRYGKFKVVDSISPTATAEFTSTNMVPLDHLLSVSFMDRGSKFEVVKGLLALTIVNYANTLNTDAYKNCGIAFDFNGGFTFNNRGDMLDQFTDAILIYMDIMLNNGDSTPVSELHWYYAFRAKDVITGQFSSVNILPKVFKKMYPNGVPTQG